MILDPVVGSALQYLCNVSPLVGLVAILEVQDPLFLASPWGAPLDVWIQVVMPSLPALLANSSGKMICYRCPLLWTVNIHQMEEQSILDVGPGTFDERGIENLLPPVQALDVSSTVEGLRDLLPVLASIDPHCLSEFLVLDFGPMPLNFGVGPFRILRPLVLGGSTFVKVRVRHLVLNQLPLGLDVIDIVFLRLFLGLLELLDGLETVDLLLIQLTCVEWLDFGILFVELHVVDVCA